jgi:hypothetical protein
MLNENRNRAIISVKAVVAKPIRERHMEFNRKAEANGNRVSNLDTSQPDKGRPTIELTGIVSRIVPNSASFRSKADLMVGIRDAQLEKLNPERKKKTLSESLCLFIDCIMVK